MYRCQIKAGTKSKGFSASAHVEYILREGEYSNRTAELLDVAYGNMPSFAADSPSEMWRLSDKYEGANRTTYRELELCFPYESDLASRIKMVDKLVAEMFKGYAWVNTQHDKHAEKENPHAHLMICDRKQDGIERTAEGFFKRANKKHPEKGGCAKAEELNGKDRGAHVEKIRERWAAIHNEFYESIGSPKHADHRTLVAQRDEKLAVAKELDDLNMEPAIVAEFRREAALLDRPADKRISRKEWFRLKRTGELAAVLEARAANRELAQAKAEIVDLQESKRLATELAAQVEKAAAEKIEADRLEADRQKAAADKIVADNAARSIRVQKMRDDHAAEQLAAAAQITTPIEATTAETAQDQLDQEPTETTASQENKSLSTQQVVDLPADTTAAAQITEAATTPTQTDPEWYLKCLYNIRELYYKWCSTKIDEDKQDFKAAIEAELKAAGHKRIEMHQDRLKPILVDGKRILNLITDEEKRLKSNQPTKGKKI